MRNLSSLLILLLTRKSSAFAASSSSSTTTRTAAPTTFVVSKRSAWMSTCARGGGAAAGAAATHLPKLVRPSTIRRHLATRSIHEAAMEHSQSIVGNSITKATFGTTSSSSSSTSTTTTSTTDAIQYYNTALMPEYRVVFVLGGPGAGKGTQCHLLLQNEYPCVHLSVGDLLRAEQNRTDSPHAAFIQDCLVAGNIVPVDISLSLLTRAMKEAAEHHGRSLIYLVDGFPRNYDNLEGWNRCMRGIASVWGVLMYTCPLEVLEERILARAATSGRSDDNLASAKKRFMTFERDTVPVVNTLRRVQEEQTTMKHHQGMILQVKDIQGNQSIAQVWSDTQAVMNEFLANDVWTANAKLLEAIEQGDEDTYRLLYAGDDDMVLAEGRPGRPIVVSQPDISFSSGTKAMTSYHRVLDGGERVRESRVWSHEGTQGWVNVHFSRIPTDS